MSIRALKIFFFLASTVFFFCIFSIPPVQYDAKIAPPPELSAEGIAVYGWIEDTKAPLLIKNANNLYPIASITKLLTARTAQELYPANKIFTISKQAASAFGEIPGIVVGAKISRNDLIKALLIDSSNDAAVALTEPVGEKVFMRRLNEILHENRYTSRSFFNASGLDSNEAYTTNNPKKTNRLTANRITDVLRDVYENDTFVKKILGTAHTTITDLTTKNTIKLENTNELLTDSTEYSKYIIMSKTGTTSMAKENLVMVVKDMTKSQQFEYITIVLLHSDDRITDGATIIEWLKKQ